jgi:two-component system OmpR family sensor kinase
MPRSLTGRLALGSIALAVAFLVGTGAGLFVVLRGLHADAVAGGLEDVAGSLLPQVRQGLTDGTLRATIADLRTQLASRGIDVLLVDGDGTLRSLDGGPVGSLDGALGADLAVGAIAHGTSVLTDGRRIAWAAVVVRPRTAVTARAIATLTTDRSGAQALGDLVRAIPLLALVLLLVGAPIAWLISRSVTRPLERLADAASRLPGGGHEPIPLEGPSEVRELTTTFNAMADELAATRSHERELLANLRHDLRTPVTVIAGFAEAIADGTASGDQVVPAADAIRAEAGRLDRLVDELGAIERVRSGRAGLRPESIVPAELLEATRDRFAARAEAAGVGLEVISSSSAPGAGSPALFVADRVSVDRMLGNLVENALRAVASGGHVWLAAQLLAGAAGAPRIALSVTDDGPGFPPGSLERVFERFYRADPSRAGTGSGLGLAIVRELAEAHGGTAIAENVAPHGARVSVVLPVTFGAAETADRP